MIDINDIDKQILTAGTDVVRLSIDALFIEQSGVLQSKIYVPEELHQMRSCSKLLVALAVGIAIDKKLLVNGEPISLQTKVFPALQNAVNITNTANLEKIQQWTVRNLLTHSTGYAKQMFDEKCIGDTPTDTLLDFALNYDIPYEVGERYAYNNVEPFVLSCLFQEAFKVDLADFVNENIFKKLGITDYEWSHYGKYCTGATGLLLKPSDFFKIGKLLLDDGIFEGEQVVPANWIHEMRKPQVATPDLYKPERVLPKINGGYFTFVSRDGYVFRDGTNGQYLVVNAEKKLLIAIMSSEENMKLVLEPFRPFL